MPTFDLADDEHGCWRFHCVFEPEQVFIEFEPHDPACDSERFSIGEFLTTPAHGEAHRHAWMRVYNFMNKVMDRM